MSTSGQGQMGQPGMMYPGGPGNVERQFNSPQYQIPLSAGGGGQPSANTSGYGSGMQNKMAVAQPGGGMDFASFMQSPQGQSLMQQIMQRKAGGGMYPGGSPGNGQFPGAGGNAPFPIRPPMPPQIRPGLGAPGSGSGLLSMGMTARPMTPVPQPPPVLPPGLVTRAPRGY